MVNDRFLFIWLTLECTRQIRTDKEYTDFHQKLLDDVNAGIRPFLFHDAIATR